MHCNCIIFNSISKFRTVDDTSLICTVCPLIEEYKELVDSNKVDIIKDMNDFNRKHKKPTKPHHKRRNRGNKRNASSNKGNPNRTLSKGRKKFKDK